MKDEYINHPERRVGLIFLAAASVFLLAVAVYGLWKAAQAAAGPVFLFALLPALIAVVLIPWLAYRIYALNGAVYILEREGIRLRWGLRVEHIPIDLVTWVRIAGDLEEKLPLPPLRLPGSVIGTQRLDSGEVIEYLAASGRGLVLIGTPSRIYAISPLDPQAFLKAYQRCTEYASLAPLPGHSVHPSLLLTRVWSSLWGRSMLLTGIVLSLALLAAVSLAIPSHERVALGYGANVAPHELVPGVRLFLLPVLNLVFFMIDMFLGLFFFRRDESQVYAYLLWASGALTPLLFLIAIFFILQSG